jgi:hypothetical protein
MDSPFLAGLNQFLGCTQATDADDSIVSDVLLLASFYPTELERSLQ